MNRTATAPRTSFIAGFFDGILARHAWDSDVRKAPKSALYIFGSIWASGIQPLALFFAVFDFFDNRTSPNALPA